MTDVIVIGAGLSGLVCAHRLVQAGKSVRVVEARDRIGGRLHSVQLGGQIVDLGGHLMTATQDRLAALATELGIASARVERSGRARFPPGGLRAAFAQWRAMRRIERMMRMPRADAERVDGKTLNDYLLTIRNPIARERLAMHAELIFAADPADFSLLAYLQRLEATGGFAPAGPELPGGGRERYFPDGAQQLATKLAEKLDVQLSSPVRAIEDRGADVRVVLDGGGACAVASPDGTFAETSSTVSVVASRVVLAIPPALVRHMSVELPAEARAYVERVNNGGVVKVLVAYARPFWREAGWSGECYRPTGTVRATLATGNVIVAFVVGREATRWRQREVEERRRDIIDTLVEELGDKARNYVELREADWAGDPWSAGCVASTQCGALADGADWGTPFGRVHVAGTESASVWPGYMDGAIEAGERAAAEVIDSA